YRAGRARDRTRGHAVLPRTRAARDRAVAGPAHRDRLRIPAVRQVLDQRVSGRRAAAADPVDQPGRRPVARRAESEAVAMSKARPLLGVRGLRTEFLTRDGVLPAV